MSYSVVLTTFNSANTIEFGLEALNYLQPQPLEVIVVDDCSSDQTLNLINKHASKNDLLKIIASVENRGQSYSRNIGILNSVSEYILIMDDDDISLPNRPQVHLEALSNGADLSYVSSSKEYTNGYKVDAVNTNLNSAPQNFRAIIKHLVLGEPLPHNEHIYAPSCSLAVNRNSFLELGGFREDMRRLEDIELVCRALKSRKEVVWSSEICLKRLHTEADDKSGYRNCVGELQVLESIKEILSKRQYFIARQMTYLRMAYFDRNLAVALKHIFLFPVVALLQPRKAFSVIRRVRHDFRQRK